MLGLPHRLTRWLPATLAALLLIYTVDQLLNGERGVVTWKMLTQQVGELGSENDSLKYDVNVLEKAVARLKPNAQKRLDEDYVDELIRERLPLVRAGEVVVLVSASD